MHKAGYQEAVKYIQGLSDLGWKPGLERCSALCERLGNPHKKIRAVHIAGTNGKGSTAAMVASILQAAGYRVGMYLSPYVYSIRERVQVNGRMIPESAFARLVNFIRPHAEALASTELGHPTEFEVKTALGLLYFVEQNVDFVALETGLGGRLDATNVVVPVVSVITNVSLDHTDRLGTTIPEIAFEKAGIIKQGAHLVTAVSGGQAMSVVRSICEERDGTLWHVHPAHSLGGGFAITEIKVGDVAAVDLAPGANGRTERLAVKGVLGEYEGIEVGLRGEFQLVNAATAVGVVEALQTKGVDVSDSAIRLGLKSAYLPGRLEVLQTNPTLLLDGSHNADGANRLAQALRTEFKYKQLILVMGMVAGHSVEDVVGALAPLSHTFIATAPSNPRAASCGSIAAAARRYCADVVQVEPVRQAVHEALSRAAGHDLVCVTGSFYVLGEVPRRIAGSPAEV